MNEQTQKQKYAPMQTKTIAKVCRAKIDDWARSVEKAGNKEIAELIRSKTLITGGALVSLLSGEEVNDYDLYLVDKHRSHLLLRR